MKVALIPPKGLENYAFRSKFHLALAIPELMSRKVYGGMYQRASATGDYVILDNGLAEGMPAEPDALIAMARALKANELVVPDVMKDSDKTVKAVKSFFARYEGLPELNYMAVVQGSEPHDFHHCVAEFAKLQFVHTVGLPRDMLGTLRMKSARLDLANWINDEYPERFEIHLLGTNPLWLTEVKSVAKYAPFVRSVDSSLPFNYAIADEVLATSTKQVTRPDKYFDIDWSRRVSGITLRQNIDTFMEWAGGKQRSETSFSRMRVLPA